MINIGWPQGLFLAWMFVALGVAAATNGQQKLETTGERKGLPELHSFPLALVWVAMLLTLLYLGGFFS